MMMMMMMMMMMILLRAGRGMADGKSAIIKQ